MGNLFMTKVQDGILRAVPRGLFAMVRNSPFFWWYPPANARQCLTRAGLLSRASMSPLASIKMHGNRCLRMSMNRAPVTGTPERVRPRSMASPTSYKVFPAPR
jgi:hypothetical protein